MPGGGSDPGNPTFEHLLAAPADYGERSPHKSRFAGRSCDPGQAMLEQPVPKDHTPWRSLFLRTTLLQPSGRPHSGGVRGALSAAGAGKDLLSMRKKEQQRWDELTTVPIPSVPAPGTHKWDTGTSGPSVIP